jgi:predicted Zn-dependent peptidase
MVLAAAGAVDHEQLVKAAEGAFGGVPDETPDTSVAALVAKVGQGARTLTRGVCVCALHGGAQQQ